MKSTTGRAKLILPRPPDRRSVNAYEELRRDLKPRNIHLTILGLTPEGRPHVKLVGGRQSVQRWLNENNFWMIPVEDA